jgi:hypothetical protein
MLAAARYPSGERRFPMADIMSILQSSYAATPQPLIPAGAKFANVDPTKWQGTWTGKDYQNQPFTISISKVSGYRANVTYQSASGLQYARAFITTKNTFRIGDSSFTLTGNGVGQINTIVTDPNTGTQTNQQAVATRTS